MTTGPGMRTEADRSHPQASTLPEAMIVTLLPFLVKGSLAIAVMRGLLARGASVAIGFCSKDAGSYPHDSLQDFESQGRLIDLSGMHPDYVREKMADEIEVRRTKLILQAGAHSLYPTLPYLKEQHPELKLVDTLYNEVGHTVNHFLYENCFDAVLVESEQMHRFVARRTSKPNPKIKIVKNGVDLARFYLPKNLSISPFLRAGFIGRMSAEKNPAAFIDIAEAVGLQLESVRFSLYGEGPLAGAIRQRIAESPMKTKIVYEGVAEDVRAALHALDVLIVPSKFDGRPNVIMEAAACGVPVIASPVGGIPELIEEERNGVLLAPEQTDRIAEILRNLASDITHRRQWRLKCRAVAEARFDARRMLDSYETAFREIIGTNCA